MLQQIVDVVDPPELVFFNRHHRVIGLAGFYRLKIYRRTSRSRLNKLLQSGERRTDAPPDASKSLGTEERHAGRMWVNFIQMLLQRGLLGKNRVFDNQLGSGG